MNRVLMGLSLLLVAVPFGYCQELTQPLQLTIKSDKQVYEVGEEITLEVTIANLSSNDIYILPLIESSYLTLDRKKYSRHGAFAWGGQGAVSPRGELTIRRLLRDYIVSQHDLTIGKHTISFNMGGTNSNAITIKVVGKEEIVKEEALKIAEKVCEESGWKWIDVSVLEDKEKWTIRTNSHADGSNAFVEIDKKTGAVLRKSFGPL